MSRLLGLSVFLAVALIIVGSTHYFLWARLVRDTQLPAPWASVTTAVLAVLGVSLPVALVLSRALAPAVARWFLWVAYVWLGLFFLTFSLLLAADVVAWGAQWLYRVFPGAVPTDPSRRLWWARISAGGVVAAASAAAGAGMRTATSGPQLVRQAVALARLPESLRDFTIAQISDLHVAPLIGRDYVASVVTQVNALAPQCIVITGDLVDGSVEDLRDAVAPLADLRAPHGVFFVTGNHEYYSGVNDWLRHLSSLGVRVLRNERVAIGNAPGFDLAGIDDFSAERFGDGHGANLTRALEGRDPRRELVLLAHQPRAVFEAAEQGVGLMLSGHTHGGQIFPFGYLVRLAQPYVAGLSRHGPTQIYVNRGTGFWGPPMRLGADPEITLLTLEPA